jgi:O-6-methylguanine DNA methyltransferase
MNYAIKSFTPSDFKKHIQNCTISYSYYITTAGIIKLSLADALLFEAFFISESQVPSDGPVLQDDDIVSLALVGTEFQIAVWKALLQVKVTSYYEAIAHVIGKPTAQRAVGSAIGSNAIAYFIPCHKIIRKDGSLGGYRWGVERKKKLLAPLL